MAKSSFYEQSSDYDVLSNVQSELDQFATTYLGAFAADPTTDNSGNAIITGALYWNTAASILKAWDGSAWRAVYDKTISITFVMDGGGARLTAGVKGDLLIPFACTLVQASLFADQAGSIVVDVWRNNYASFPPTVANTVTGSNPPTISSTNKNQDSVLNSWTVDISAGDTLRINVVSVTSITRCTLALKALKTG